MYTKALSLQYLNSVTKGDVIAIKGQLYSATGVPGEWLEITDGTITFDYTASTRRTASLTISDPTRSLVPVLATDKLAPYGQSMALYMGPDLDGQPLVPMGVYQIQSAEADDQGTQFEFTITGYDKSGKIAREALTQVYTIAAGTNYATAIKSLLQSRDSTIVFNFTFTGYTTPLIVLDVNQDPWAAALQMASAIGCDLYFDRTGICVMRPTPDPASVAQSWIYSDTNMGYGMMLDELIKTVTADNTVYNNVIVSGEASGTTTTYSGNAFDGNPNSPTYVNGPFGDIPVFYKSSIVTSDAQAQALANAKLLYYLGRSDQMTIQGPPNPVQDEEDVVKVVRNVDGVNGLYTIDKCEFTLAAAGENTKSSGSSTGSSTSGQQTLTCRGVIPGL